MTRGLEGRTIFLDDADRLDLVDRLCAILPEAGMHCFAWALMSNHLHLVVQTPDVPLSRVMKRLNTGYACTFNLRHGRRGYLFQNRFKSRLVGGDDDLVGVIRYVHLNPLKAGVVSGLDELADYTWCGHGAIVGVRPALPFESIAPVLNLVADEPAEARRRWRGWMAAGLGIGVDEGISADPFTGAIETGRVSAGPGPGDPDSAPAAIQDLCQRLGVPLRTLRGGRRERRLVDARAVVAYFAVVRLGMPGVRVASMLGISGACVSRALDRGRRIWREGPAALRG
jgi:REP element-mobilizing transposase RayT